MKRLIALRVGFWQWGALVLLVGVMLMLGCQPRAASKPREEAPIKVLGLLYGQFIGQNMGRPPASEEQFRSFVQKQGAFLKQMNVESPEQIFRSNRDGEPYVVLYGDLSKAGQLSGAPIVAWEAKGAGGKRYIVNSLGAVKEVTEEEFKQLVP